MIHAPEAIVAYDLLARKVVWQVDLTPYVTYFVKDTTLVLVSGVFHPAVGLQNASTDYTVTAIDLVNGQTRWRSALPGEHTVGLNAGAAWEGIAGVQGHPGSVVVAFGSKTASYDAADGSLLWTADRSIVEYITAGVFQIGGYQDNAFGTHLTGFSAQAGNQLWDLRLMSGCEFGRDHALVGTVMWGFGGEFKSCVTRYDVASGKLLQADPYPASWKDVAGSPLGMLVWDGARLAEFRPDNLVTPIWSVPADQTEPLSISTGHVLVRAPSGILLLSATDGSQTATVPAIFGNGGDQLRDGVAVSVSEGGEVYVLAVDPLA